MPASIIGTDKTASTSTKVSISSPPPEALNQTFSGDGDSPIDDSFAVDAADAVKKYEPSQLPQREANTGKFVKTSSEPKAEPSNTKGDVAQGKPESEEQPSGEATAATSVKEAAGQPKAPAAVSKPISAEPTNRDYTGFSTEEQAVLKKMSNASFKFATELIKKNKELSSKTSSVPDTYYQHPEGYQLDPAFKEVQTDVWYAEQEGKYWENQLYKMQEGEEWIPLVGYNADGTFKFGDKRASTPRDVEQVRRAMNDCWAAKNQKTGAMQAYIQQHQQRVQQDNGVIQQEQAKRFGWVADPKQLENTIDVPGIGEKSIGQIKQDFSNLFPTYHRNHVAVDVASNLFAALQIYASKIRDLESTNKVSEIKREEAVRGEPKSSAKPQGKGKTIHGLSEFSLEGMPE